MDITDTGASSGNEDNNSDLEMDRDDIVESQAGEAIENARDEADIISDRDQTLSAADSAPSRSRMTGNVEDEPDAFARGEVDVATQMARTQRSMEADLNGYSARSATEDDRAPNV